jgi:hypothetical protein
MFINLMLQKTMLMLGVIKFLVLVVARCDMLTPPVGRSTLQKVAVLRKTSASTTTSSHRIETGINERKLHVLCELYRIPRLVPYDSVCARESLCSRDLKGSSGSHVLPASVTACHSVGVSSPVHVGETGRRLVAARSKAPSLPKVIGLVVPVVSCKHGVDTCTQRVGGTGRRVPALGIAGLVMDISVPYLCDT